MTASGSSSSKYLQRNFFSLQVKKNKSEGEFCSNYYSDRRLICFSFFIRYFHFLSHMHCFDCFHMRECIGRYFFVKPILFLFLQIFAKMCTVCTVLVVREVTVCASLIVQMTTIRFVVATEVHIVTTVKWDEELVPKLFIFQLYSMENVIARCRPEKVWEIHSAIEANYNEIKYNQSWEG